MADEEKKLNTSEYSQEELERIARIDRLDRNTGRKKLILATVTAALILIFALGTVFGGKYILSYEGTEALPTVYAQYPTEEKEIADLFGTMLKEIYENDHVKVNRRASVSIDGGSIEGSSAVQSYVSFVREDLADNLTKLYADFQHNGTYEEDCAEYLPEIFFNPTVCKISAEENTGNAAEIRLTGVYDLQNTDALNDMFYFDMEQELLQQLDNSFAGIMEITNPEFTLTDAELTASYNRNDEPNVLNELTLTKKYHVTLVGIFADEHADIYSEDCSFDVTVSNTYRFSRVTFRFNSDIIYIEKGDNEEFKYTLVTDESPAEVKIDIQSENPDVVSIDKYGYYKGHTVSDTPVTVTGTYTYLGKTYTDTIKVLVRTPVENVKLSTKELTMTVGETASLTLTFKPENAQVKDVKWFTENEEIATVDENGVITAVGEGEVKVYLISLDGSFKRGCTVTVTKEGGNTNG